MTTAKHTTIASWANSPARHLGTALALALVSAVAACNETGTAGSGVQAEGNTPEVTASLTPLPEKAQELSPALDHSDPSELSNEDCDSPFGCRSAAKGPGHDLGHGPMMTPIPGPPMMGSPRKSEAMAGVDSKPGEMAMPKGTDIRKGHKGGSGPEPVIMPKSLHGIGAVDFFLDQTETLALSVQQEKRLRQIKQRAFRDVSDAQSEHEAAEEELWRLTAAAQPDIQKIERQIDSAAGITARRRAAFIMAVGHATNVLTEAQRRKIEEAAPPPRSGQPSGKAMGHGMGATKMGSSAGDGRGMNMGNPKRNMGDSHGMNMDDKSDRMGMGHDMGGEMGMAMMGRDPAAAAPDEPPITATLPGFPGRSHLYHVGATGFYLDHSEGVQLTDAQRNKLLRIQQQAEEQMGEIRRRISIAEHDLFVMTSQSSLDRGRIDAVVDRIAHLHAEARLTFIQAVGRAALTLTDSQRRAMVEAFVREQTHGAGPSAE